MTDQTTLIYQIPFEIIELILYELPLPAIAAFAQTCRAFRNLLYEPADDFFWRTTFLREFDDPRSIEGKEARIQWDVLLRRWMGAVNKLRKSPPAPTIEVLRVLEDIVDRAAPLPAVSRNITITESLLESSGILNDEVNTSYIDDPRDPGNEYTQLIYRLRVYRGWESIVSNQQERLKARSFTYNLRQYNDANDYGPFLQDGSYRVHWKHVFMIQEVIGMNIMEFMPEDQRLLLPMNMKSTQRPKEMPIKDWAGVTGTWEVIFCFCDHRDLLAFNRLNFVNILFTMFEPHDRRSEQTFQHEPDISVFEDETFEEALRYLEFELRLIEPHEASSEPLPVSAWPSRPTLHFVGKIGDHPRVNGCVYMTSENHIRWSFTSGDPGQTIWSTEAVQIGPPGSTFGALGAWTTVFHDVDDPVGPMWLWKKH
ncbi:hypothetical protein M422DRAFT_41959 [Sphaerobolus stellatus SS14]|nr:hypothetical protein M422DRAFT_41959 [Sphaerobolus stellatus SS14]